jgi:hypothetical protein
VDGVLTPMYTTAVEPAVANALLLPFGALPKCGYYKTAFGGGVAPPMCLASVGQL